MTKKARPKTSARLASMGTLQGDDHKPRYFKSPSGLWIECDWDERRQRYVCKDIDESDLPDPLERK